MSKKVYIIPGHGGKDPGAVRYITEKEYTLKTAFALAELLSAAGVDYKMSRTQDIEIDMDKYIRECNAYKPDLVISIHFNAGGGTGFEVYHSIVGGTGKALAENINTEVKKIFGSRGVKTKKGDGGKDYFAVIRETDAPAVLCEGGFVDTQSDAEFVKANYKKLAKAYADGIFKTLGVTVNTPQTSAAKVLDTAGCKYGDGRKNDDRALAVLNLKALLLTAKYLGITAQNMDKNSIFGDGTLKAVNFLLKKWGYAQNGIAGEHFTLRILEEIERKCAG